jgi:signal transduction histidine kinase
MAYESSLSGVQCWGEEGSMGLVSFVTTWWRENTPGAVSGFGSDRGLDDRLIEERKRVAQALHDTLLQGFFAASMHLHSAVDQLPGDSPAKSQLGEVLRLVDRTLDEGRRAVEGLRSRHRPGGSLSEALAGVLNDLSLPASTEFRVVVHGKERALADGPFEEVYRIGREAILNAYRHSRAKLIETEIKYRSTEVLIAVRDNGCGIDAHHLQRQGGRHWGLMGMRERAERIDARLWVLSKVTVGTEVELRVPNRVAFKQTGSSANAPRAQS